MNVPPTCDYAMHGCSETAIFTVINKTQGKITYACSNCMAWVFIGEKEERSTYSIFPAKDYSRPQDCICHETVVGKDRCPVHGKPAQAAVVKRFNTPRCSGCGKVLNTSSGMLCGFCKDRR